MSANFNNNQLPGNSAFANVLVVVLGAIAIAVSFVIGVVAFVALAAAVIVLGAIIWIRIWWLGVKSRKRTGQQPQAGRAGGSRTESNAVIEGEYRVIQEKKDDDNAPQT